MSTIEAQAPRPGAHHPVIAVCVALIALCFVMSYFTFHEVGGVVDLIRVIFSVWWGIAFSVEHYIALSIIAGWIWAIEEDRRTATLWIVALYLVGSVVALFYVIRRAWRADSLRAVFVGRVAPGERLQATTMSSI